MHSKNPANSIEYWNSGSRHRGEYVEWGTRRIYITIIIKKKYGIKSRDEMKIKQIEKKKLMTSLSVSNSTPDSLYIANE